MLDSSRVKNRTPRRHRRGGEGRRGAISAPVSKKAAQAVFWGLPFRGGVFYLQGEVLKDKPPNPALQLTACDSPRYGDQAQGSQWWYPVHTGRS
jgi:hypothetical protein